MKRRTPSPSPTGENASANGPLDGGASPVLVVGVGAAARGLASLRRILAAIPPGRGIAVVLVYHPKIAARNPLALLKGNTGLAVVAATEGMPVLADRIHVMPPGKFLSIMADRLTLKVPVHCNGLLMPIDHFFCSLAADRRNRCCGILLADTGSDGTLGFSEILTAGGRTIRVGGPKGVRAAGADPADAVLPAEAVAGAIVELAERAAALNGRLSLPEAGLAPILEILRARIGHDFNGYKPNTLMRRVRRRMALGRAESMEGYVRYLSDNPDEVGLLLKDLLIGVTDFFRQPQAWETLERKVIAPLTESAVPGSVIRVWIAGCSSGKEVYSLAMLLAEQAAVSSGQVDFQIFATDADAVALATARTGCYTAEEIGPNVSPERLKRFFTRRDSRYQVLKSLRGRIVFAAQNLTADPPLSRLDLVVCRNLLIYLDLPMQRRIITLFHFALREAGFLFLGNAETVGEREDLFEPLAKKWRIYRRIGVGRRMSAEIPVRPAGAACAAAVRPVAAGMPRPSLTSTAQHVLLDRFAPACVLIDRKYQVLYTHGEIANYLTFPAGELTTLVTDMAREGLRVRLRGTIGKCIESGRTVSFTARTRRDGKDVTVKTTVIPLRYLKGSDGLMLVTFEDRRALADKAGGPAADRGDIRELTDELKITREELQSTIDQLEGSNDQLKAANEEAMAANEELQAANEEMETSKEELQSLNEELNAINLRLQEKVEELESVNNDVQNFLASTNIATLFLDKSFRIKRYTPAMTRLMSLIPTDLGRPLAGIQKRFTDETLLDDARQVLVELTLLAKEVRMDDGRWYIRRVTPYRTQEDRIEGVVITFVDVAEIKQAEEEIRRSERRLKRAQEIAQLGSWELDLIENRLIWSDEVYRIFGLPPQSFAATYEAFLARVHPEDRGAVDAAYAGSLQENLDTYEIEHRVVREQTGEVRFVHERCQHFRDESGAIVRSVGMVHDITERKRNEENIRRQSELLAAVNGILNAALQPGTEELLGRTCLELIARVTDSPIGFIGKIGPEGLQEIASSDSGRETGRGITAAGQRRPAGSLKIPDLYGPILRESRGYFTSEPAVPPDGSALSGGHCPPGSFLGVPLTSRGSVIGVIGLGDRPGGYSRAELEGLEVLAPVVVEAIARKRAEEALRRLNAELEERVTRQTAELRQAYAALKTERQRFHDVLEMLPAYVVLLTPDHHVPFANRTFRERFGEAPGRRCYEHLFGRTEPCEVCESYSVLSTGDPHNWKWTGPDGRSYDVFDYPFRDSEGASFILEMGIDITDVTRAEAALREANETLERRVAERTAELEAARTEAEGGRRLLESVMEALPVGVAIINAHGELRQSNQTFDTIWDGLRPAANAAGNVAGRVTWAETGEPVGPEEWASARAIREGETVCGQLLEINRGDGSRVFVLNSASPVTDAGGRIIGGAVAVQDITALRHAEEALREAEARVRLKLESILSPEGEIGNLELADIIDVAAIQSLMTDFYDLARIPMAVIDLKGRVIVGVGWQEVCTKFHRTHPETGRYCVESDTKLTTDVSPGHYKLYKCKNHLWDVATPIIVGGRHVGNVFAGQFFFNDEQIDYGLFREQAARYGFDEASYITALEDVPRLNREEVETGMAFFMKFAGLISQLSYANIKLAHSVSERDALMASLSASEERLKLFIEHAPAALAMFDRQMRYLSVSRRWRSDYGLDDAELTGLSHYDVFPEVSGAWKEAYRRGLAGEVVRADADRFLRADGTEQWVRWEIRPWYDGAGEVGGIVIFSEDMTMLMQASETLKHRSEELAATNRELESFSYSVSHDLQAPLRAIDGYSRMILRRHGEQLDEEARAKFNVIRSNAQMMGRLIDDLLSFSRLGKAHLSLAPLAMGDLVREVWEQIRAANPERHVTLSVAEMPPAMADRGLLRQVLANILSNAVKFTRERPEARIEVGGYVREGEFIYTVRDNGIGFDMQYHDKLFGVFQRLHGADEYEGTGVGLAIVQRIINRHGGRVWAEGELGRGACLHFTLPPEKTGC